MSDSGQHKDCQTEIRIDIKKSDQLVSKEQWPTIGILRLVMGSPKAEMINRSGCRRNGLEQREGERGAQHRRWWHGRHACRRFGSVRIHGGTAPIAVYAVREVNLMNAIEEALVGPVESETCGGKPPPGGESPVGENFESDRDEGYAEFAMMCAVKRLRFDVGHPSQVLVSGVPECYAAPLIEWIATTCREAGLHVPSPLHVHRDMRTSELLLYIKLGLGALAEMGGSGVLIVDGIEKVHGTGVVIRGANQINLRSCSLVIIGTVPDTSEPVVLHPDCCVTALAIARARNHMPVPDRVSRLIQRERLLFTNETATSCTHYRYGCFMEEDGVRIASLMLHDIFGRDCYPESAVPILLHAANGSVYQLEACIGMLKRQLELSGYKRLSRDGLCTRLERYVRYVNRRRTWPTGRTYHVCRDDDHWARFLGKELDQ